MSLPPLFSGAGLIVLLRNWAWAALRFTKRTERKLATAGDL